MKDNVPGTDPWRNGTAPPQPAPPPGVYSEVGKLHTVLVCQPGLAHERLNPRICRELKFGAPLWVERAQHDFSEFVRALREQGVEVLELHTLLAQTLAQPEACTWLLDRLLKHLNLPDVLGDELRAACEDLDPRRLAELLIGGVTLADLGLPSSGVMGMALALRPFVLPPLPHTLCLRESHCWIQSGLALNFAGRHGTRPEALLVAAVYRFHPRFSAAQPRVWWGDADAPAPGGSAEGGDIMALGHGVVLIGTGARTQPHAALQIARGLFEDGAAHTVIAAQSARHDEPGAPLERYFTQCAPNVVTYRPDVVDHIRCQELRPAGNDGRIQVTPRDGVHLLDVLAQALGAPTFNAIVTACETHDGTGEPWDDGNGALALEPGVVIAFERNARTNKRLRGSGIEVIEVPGSELDRIGTGTRGLCCPIAREAVM